MKRKVMMIMLLLPFTWLVMACSNDDDSKSVRQQLVGVWKTSMSSSNWKQIELVSDGTLHYGLKINSNGEYSYNSLDESSHWSYNESEQTISMYSDDGYYAYTYKVNMADDGNSWAGYEIKSDETKTYTFTRVENAKKVN